MMWRTVIIWGCFVGAVLASPVGVKDIPMVNDDLLNEKTEMAMSTLNLPSNATSIRADITDGFNCDGRLYGYYADIDNDCQIFHVCLPVTYPDGKENTFRWSFICPEDTIFSQESFTCVRSLDLGYDCAESMRFYDLNRNFGVAGDMDSEMPDMLRKTSADETNNVPQEPLKPIVPVTTAAPLPTRRRPVESIYRRQPTKATPTVAPTVKAKPTRVIPPAALSPIASAPVVKAKPSRIIPTSTMSPITSAAVIKMKPTRVIAPTTSAPAEIKPMFDRNEFMKNNPSNGIRKTPVRLIPAKEASEPAEVVSKIDIDSESMTPIEEGIKKMPLKPIESAPPMKVEAIQPNTNLNQEPNFSKPLENIPSDGTKANIPDLQNASSLPESPNMPSNAPSPDNSVVTRLSSDSPDEQSVEQMANEKQDKTPKDPMPMSETNTPETQKVSDSLGSASTENKLSEEVVPLPEGNVAGEAVEVVMPANTNQLNAMSAQSPEKAGSEMQQAMEKEQASAVEEVQQQADMKQTQPESSPGMLMDQMPESESVPVEALDDSVVKKVLESIAYLENGLDFIQDEQVDAEPMKPIYDDPAPMDMSADLTKQNVENVMDRETMEPEPVKKVEEAEMSLEGSPENKDMAMQSEINEEIGANMASQDMDALKTDSGPVASEDSFGSEQTLPTKIEVMPNEFQSPEMDSINVEMAEMNKIKPLNVELQAPKLDSEDSQKDSIMSPNESAMPNAESKPSKPEESEKEKLETAAIESESVSNNEESVIPAQEPEQIMKVDSDTKEELAEMEPQPMDGMPAMNSEEQKSEIVKTISSLVTQATQEAVSKIQEALPAEARPTNEQIMPEAPAMAAMAATASGSVAMTDMDTLMASPALLDNSRSEMPLFIPVRVLMDNEPLTKINSSPEIAEKDEMPSPESQAASVMSDNSKIAQSEPINVESPAAQEMVVGNTEAVVPEKKVTQIILETEPVVRVDKPADPAAAALKAEILPMPVEEVRIVEDKPKIEMEMPDQTETMAGTSLDAPMAEPMLSEASSMSELSQEASASPTPDALLVEAQPFLQEMIDLASNLVKAETLSAAADDFPMVVDPADSAKGSPASASQPFSKSAPSVDVLDGVQMADVDPPKPTATFPEPIEEADRRNELVSDLLRIVTPQRIGELVERTALPESAANRADLARSLQRKVDPRKRRFLFKSSANSR